MNAENPTVRAMSKPDMTTRLLSSPRGPRRLAMKSRKPAPVTLAQLRKAAPKEWEVTEEDKWLNGLWDVWAADTDGQVMIDIWHPSRQLCRRAALAAPSCSRGQ